MIFFLDKNDNGRKDTVRVFVLNRIHTNNFLSFLIILGSYSTEIMLNGNSRRNNVLKR